MTKDPVPPSQKGAGTPWPPPPGLDDVMEEGLAKNPNIRTKTVGALADAVGRAYGLEGDHRGWARMPQQELARIVAEARPRVMQPKPQLSAAADPFAEPSRTNPMQQPYGNYGNPGPGQMMAPRQAAGAMDQAFSAVRQNDYGDMNVGAMGIPQGRARRGSIPVIVGAVALVVGGALAAVFAMSN